MRQDDHGFWQTWVAANATLAAQAKITDGVADSGWPVWAPGGRRIAFDSSRADPDPTDDVAINDIFTLRPDGSGLVKLTDSAGFSADAGYSPDGRWIVFDSDRGDNPAQQGIYVMAAADGSRLRRVTTLPAGDEVDSAPRFSPDGRRIVFTRYRPLDGGEGQSLSALFVVRPDGSGLRQITGWDLRAGDADWSPDGRWIVFETQNLFGDVQVVKPDGSKLTNITHNVVEGERQEGSADPVWSPDGRTILFIDGRNSPDGFVAGLATMRPNGKDRRNASDPPQAEHQPDWESISRRGEESGGR
jgi:Tol biopolymer transport system component